MSISAARFSGYFALWGTPREMSVYSEKFGLDANVYDAKQRRLIGGNGKGYPLLAQLLAPREGFLAFVVPNNGDAFVRDVLADHDNHYVIPNLKSPETFATDKFIQTTDPLLSRIKQEKFLREQLYTPQPLPKLQEKARQNGRGNDTETGFQGED